MIRLKKCCGYSVRHYWLFFLMWFQKPLNEETTPFQTEIKEEEPVASRKLNMTAKKVHGREMKGPPFTSKPEVILFKVRLIPRLSSEFLYIKWNSF